MLQPPRRPQDTMLLSGWVFADLLLALMLIFLVTGSSGLPHSPMPRPSATPTDTATPAPTPTPTPTPTDSHSPTPATPQTPVHKPNPAIARLAEQDAIAAAVAATIAAQPTLPATATPTLTPTLTPTPTTTPTPSSTATPSPTPNATFAYLAFKNAVAIDVAATIAAIPTPTPTYTPTSTPLPLHTVAVEGPVMATERKELTLRTNPTLLLGAPGARRNAELDKVRAALEDELNRVKLQEGAIVGVGLTFGTSPRPNEGNLIAAEVNTILKESFPSLFDRAVLEPFHTISDDEGKRGVVTVWLYSLVQ